MNCNNSSVCIEVIPRVSSARLDGFFDLLQLTRQAPKNTFLSIKKVKSNGCVHLTFKRPSLSNHAGHQSADGNETLVKWTLQRLIVNVVSEVKSLVPTAQLEDIPDFLMLLLQQRQHRKQDAFGPAGIQRLLTRAGEVISRVTNAELGHSRAEREAPRTPTDCLIDWIAFLSKSNLAFADVLLQEAKQCWEQGNVTLHNLTALLQKVQMQPCSTEHLSLQCKARSLLAQSAFSAQEPLATTSACQISAEQVPYTQLHDNLYGRVFDSALAAYLLHCLPDGALRATYDMCLYLADCLDATGNADAKEACKEVCIDLRNDRRFWTPTKSEFERLLDTMNDKKRLCRIKRILRAAPRDGSDILLRQCIAVKLMVALRDVGSKRVPWMARADYSYCAVVKPQRKRLGNIAVILGAAQPTGGITLSYQPPILQQSWMIRSIRALERYKPDLTNPSSSISVALEAGIPYASGISGSTNVMLHLASHMKKKCGWQIDMQHALLSILLFVVYDGGHSIHEVMWIANYLNTVLELELNFEAGAHPMKYVGSTAQFERLFDGSASAEDIRVAKQAAWEKTLQTFHTYSHYASA